MSYTKKGLIIFLLFSLKNNCPPLPQLESSDQQTSTLSLAAIISIGTTAGYAGASHSLRAAKNCFKAFRKKELIKASLAGTQATAYPLLILKLTELTSDKNSELQLLTQTLEIAFVAACAGYIGVQLLCARPPIQKKIANITQK